MTAHEFIEDYAALLDERDGIKSLIKFATITLNRAYFISLINILDTAGIDSVNPRIEVLREYCQTAVHNYKNTQTKYSIVTLEEYLKKNFNYNLELPEQIVNKVIAETIENNT